MLTLTFQAVLNISLCEDYGRCNICKSEIRPIMGTTLNPNKPNQTKRENHSKHTDRSFGLHQAQLLWKLSLQYTEIGAAHQGLMAVLREGVLLQVDTGLSHISVNIPREMNKKYSYGW